MGERIYGSCSEKESRRYLAKGGPATLHGAQIKTEPSNHDFQFGTLNYL